MPNLTFYHPPIIHLNRELPKSYCDLIQHEFNYIHFLQTRIANVQSSLAFRNKKKFVNNIQQHSYFDQNNLKLSRQSWRGERKANVDCRNESYKKERNRSHFYLRQKRWKEKIESENQRFIHSLIYHRKKYRPIHDRSATQKAYEQHLKLLETMSQYSKYNLNNSICKNLLNKMKFNTQIPQTNKPIKYSHVENILQQTINNAIHIYTQPLPSPPIRVKASYSENNQWSKPRLYHQQKRFRSLSCHQLLRPRYNKKQ